MSGSEKIVEKTISRVFRQFEERAIQKQLA
jgi:hypothetical protein